MYIRFTKDMTGKVPDKNEGVTDRTYYKSQNQEWDYSILERRGYLIARVSKELFHPESG